MLSEKLNEAGFDSQAVELRKSQSEDLHIRIFSTHIFFWFWNAFWRARCFPFSAMAAWRLLEVPGLFLVEGVLDFLEEDAESFLVEVSEMATEASVAVINYAIGPQRPFERITGLASDIFNIFCGFGRALVDRDNYSYVLFRVLVC